MNFNLEVQLRIDGTGVAQTGAFNARKAEEIPEVAYQFIQHIKRETGYRETIIEKVIINHDHDITDMVLEIENRPIPKMDDVWW
ncbi:hypothetical protein [Neobacillus terrae]|uniref:hypothetical protein n=1 Tax=Neobacillus terrae TaxID=3034837 RepID=UPI00140D67F9|nr:hypothetical protein [Neobacillus terrae]NHM31283.1 hypothetical protein [Neobacillus terrae]